MSVEMHGNIILPPGLYLPLPEEDTERFRREDFNHPHHDYEDVIELGMFATALIVWASPETKRVNAMPSREDMRALFDAGYGIQGNMLHRYYGGVSRLQESLGFYTRNSRPGREETLARLEWIRAEALPRDESFDVAQPDPLRAILSWGKKRSLLPSELAVMEALGHDKYFPKLVLGIAERPMIKKEYKPSDVYRFGAMIVAEHGAPITAEEIDVLYADAFKAKPSNVINAHFGSATNFWLSMGYYPDTKGMTVDQYIDAGVRLRIAQPDSILTQREITNMSAAKVFPSPTAITQHFCRLSAYYVEVDKAYGQYTAIRNELMAAGVSEEIMQLIGRTYRSGDVTLQRWRKYTFDLRLLSADNEEARYMRSLMKDGLDLFDGEVYEMQKEEVMKYLKRRGTIHRRRFILGLIPRIDVDEWLPLPDEVPRRQYTFKTRTPSQQIR